MGRFIFTEETIKQHADVINTETLVMLNITGDSKIETVNPHTSKLQKYEFTLGHLKLVACFPPASA